MMKKHAMTLAAAVSVGALCHVATSRADDTRESSSTTESQTAPSTTTTPQPSQSVTVTAPPAPTGTTMTTAAPFTPMHAGGETYAESTMERRPNRPLLATGAGIFVLSYGASALVAMSSPQAADGKLGIPVVGPWLDLGDRPGGGSNEDLNKALIISSGIAQGAGILIALSSLAIPETMTMTERRLMTAAPKPGLRVVPVSYAAGAGIAAMGRF